MVVAGKSCSPSSVKRSRELSRVQSETDSPTCSRPKSRRTCKG